MHTSLIQITDCHLTAGDTVLHGIDSSASLDAVSEMIRRERTEVSLLIGTGDISNDGSTATYARFTRQLAGMADRLCWVPGNHDDPMAMSGFEIAGSFGKTAISLDDWQILLLDSRVAGKIHGVLSDDQLAWLAERLVTIRRDHILLVLHHHIEPVGSPWMDHWMLRNAAALFEVMAMSNKVRGVLYGHVHQEIDYMRSGVRVLGTPSSSFQFRPGTLEFDVDDKLPGYRWLQLRGDGAIETGVSRVEDRRFRSTREALN